MEKLCVFCGNKPQSKNKEHVIPQWLLELTGDPKRIFYLGTPWISASSERSYAASQFQFPACQKCNERYSDLEGKAKNVIETILNNGKVTIEEIDLLLDWFDKVRVGLWLGYRYLEKNYFRITPHFYIDSRIGQADRVLYVYYLSDKLEGLSFIGITSPVFSHMPSCFSLRIKNVLFLNISTEFLIARRVGFPYPNSVYLDESGMKHLKVNEPMERMLKPIIKGALKTPDYAFFQPIIPFPHEMIRGSIFENQYVQMHLLSPESRKGNIIYSNGLFYKWLSPRTEIELVDSQKRTLDNSLDLIKMLTIQLYDFQMKLFDQEIRENISGLTTEEKTAIRKTLQYVKTIQNLITANTRKISPEELFKAK